MQDRHALLIGGAGYIGRHVGFELKDRGYRLTIVDDLSTGSPKYLPTTDLRVADVLELDFSELEDLKGRVTDVVHLAALTSVPQSVEDPTSFFRTNTYGTVRAAMLASYLESENFILSSTAAVYGEPRYNPVDEGHPLRPINPYGSSKLAGEVAGLEMCKRLGLGYGVLRYFNVAGADPALRTGDMRPTGDNLVHNLMECVDEANGQEFQIYGADYATPDGTAVRDFVHVVDVASAHAAILAHLTKSGVPSVVVNVGYGFGRSVEELVAALHRVAATRFSVDVKKADRRPGDPSAVWANSDRLESLGWQANCTSIERIFSTELAWHDKLKNQGA